MEYLIFINPLSSIYKNGNILKIKKIFNNRNIFPEIFISKYAGHMPELVKEKILQFSSKSKNLIIIAIGGDGTLREVIEGTLKSGVKNINIGYIPSGTANIIAKELNIPLNIFKATENIIKKSEKSKIIKLSKADKKYFLFSCGIGIDGRIVKNVNLKLKKSLGALAYVLSGLKEIFSKENNEIFEIHIDNKKFFVNSCIINRTQKYAGNFKIFKKGGLDKDYFEILIFYKFSIPVFLAFFIFLIFNKRISKNFHFLTGKKIKIITEKKNPTQLDGDFISFTPEQISISSEYIKIIGI